MKSILPILLLVVLSGTGIIAQSSFLGVKGGIGLNQQRWNNFERGILFSPLVDVFAESNDGLPSRLYASLGYHTRGSSVRGFNFSSFSSYKFNNLVLEVGGKRMLSMDKKYNGYYVLGLRGEYTIGTNFETLNTNSILNLVNDVYVNKLNYGATVGGGFEYQVSEDKIAFIELSINPDLSKQYEQLESFTYMDPNGITYQIRPQEVRNLSLELKVGMKFMRGYIEDEED